LLVVYAAAAPSSSAADFGIVPGSLEIAMLDAEGNPETRAGSHPDRLQIDFALDVEDTGTTPRDFVFELPPGLAGSSSAVPECPRAVFEGDTETCPDESQVGVVTLGLAGFGDVELPLFQVEPPPGQLISFSSLPGLDSTVEMEMRPEDSGVTFKSTDMTPAMITKGHFELWGIPADRQEGTAIPRRAFLTAPTRCGPVGITIRTRSWQDGAPWLSASAETAVPLSGCEDLTFEPRLGMRLSNPRADSATGIEMELTMPQGGDPDGLASAQLESMTMEMPEGVTVSPGAAGGIEVCSDAQFGLGSNGEAACPPASNIGTVEVLSPSVRTPLLGTVYIGEERPGERFRMLVTASAVGVVTKFVGVLEADPVTGRLSATMKGLPQVPIERLALNIDSGAEPMLASPLTCGSFSGTGRFTPYGGGPVRASAASVSIAAAADGSPCPPAPPFSPQLTVTSSGHAAGRPTAISVTLRRQAGEQLPRRFAVTMPKGLSTALRGIELCQSAAAAASACPASSRIGSALAETGSGGSLVALEGDVFMAGAYRRAPFSLVMIFRARIGAFDLGTMTVRSALRIDGRTGQATVESDPLPAVVEGVPVRFRTVRMMLDRLGMIRNPTSCAPAAFSAVVEGSGGATASMTSALIVNQCDRLGFKPRLSIALTGRGQLHKSGKPGMRISAHLRRGDASLRAMRMSLPPALQFGLSGLSEICPRRDASEGLCTWRAQVGTAFARGPMLDEELKGSVYVVQPKGDGMPDLWVSVTADGIRMDLRGKTLLRDGRIVTHLVGLPDTPLSAFSMQLRSGRRSALRLKTAPCVRGRARALRSPVLARAQNGARRTLRVRIKAPCGAGG